MILYSEYDSRKSFNRINKPETSLLFSQENSSSHELGSGGGEGEVGDSSGMEGVHEVRLAWRHIRHSLSKTCPDLLQTLQGKCTDNDLEEFQKDLNIKLPPCVIEFYKLTDGQLNFGVDNMIYGLLFGLKLLSLDEILVQTETWRKVAKVVNQLFAADSKLSKLSSTHTFQSALNKKLSGSTDLLISYNESRATTPGSSKSMEEVETGQGLGQQSILLVDFSKLPKQYSVPLGAIHQSFAHPQWIPMISDDVGNYIGIDLSPPPNGPGNWGQVILFGREFDTKFKVANNWGDFLLIFANDLEIGNYDLKRPEKSVDLDMIVGQEGDLVFVDKQHNNSIEIPYLEALKERSINNWIKSLKKVEELDDDSKNLLANLQSKKRNYDSLKSLNLHSIDTEIEKNLSSIDGMNTPLNSGSLDIRRATRISNATERTSTGDDTTLVTSKGSPKLEYSKSLTIGITYNDIAHDEDDEDDDDDDDDDDD
ncbi:uncharacterized protein KQ657_002160 [Scheffersomyces spartinae]|uniref:Knr4/Smi1-like domain-containing protein n=1 Tax=Scheffersomyces spartinae TaxID=45513 RepID=A0A9P7VCW9_9ASCO|nr:uncharacterized protein KQ657_002160 [Scheffersomyces spartinae]KAG7195775.1 hypothetical protein KQ657_002160 [Scheffersomyces spartinae]